ncbi:unnamed protein product [Oppiella nova]|uniref:Uncharacterized protein n=1 Tax=Oppiella nova TaxID=334625 RepID=A0A7R9LXQ8_9ACAR|nr:unnamed protein product [Oppiella nova]CAG2168014.1 unnamed protein product [Oppiella nova]
MYIQFIINAFLCLIGIQCCSSQKLDYPIYYAEDICDGTVSVGSEPHNSSLIIKLMKNNSSREIKSCKVSIRSTSSHKININTKHVIEAYQSHNLDSRNTITITELNDKRRVNIDFNGLGDDMYLVITAYKEIKDDEKCPKNYFLCDQNKCIHTIFRCDSYVNCIYDENELECALDITPGETILVTIILAIICSLFGTTCLLSSYVYYMYYRKREGLLDSKQISYGTINTSVPNSVQTSLKVFK